MTQKMEIIPAGSLLTISTGEYSDYSIHGVFRAIHNIDAETLRLRWLADHPEEAERYRFNAMAFLAAATKAGLVEQVECWEWHLDDDCDASDMTVRKINA